jgi:hypothetical protein
MPDRYGSISISEEADSGREEKPAVHRPVPPKRKRAGRNHALLWATLAAVFIAFYFLAAVYLAPLALRKYLPSYLAKSTGLNFSMGNVKLNPFNFQLTFNDIKADPPDSTSGQPLLEIPFLFIDLDLTSLLRNSFVCHTLTVKNLSLNITRFKDKHYNLPVLTRLIEEKKQEQIIDFTNLPFLFSFNNIDISDSRILLIDQTRDKTHTVEQLHIAIPTLSNFQFQLNDYILPHFSALINGSFIQLDGKKVALEDGKNFQTKLYCSIKNLQLSSYLSYLPDDFPLTLSKGVADLDLELGFSPNKKQSDAISIDINMTGSDMLMHTRKGNNKISLPLVKVDATLTPANRLLRIKTIIAKKPQLITSQEELPRGLANFLAIGSPSSKRLGLIIDMLLFDEGRLVFTDKKESVWNALQLSINDFDRRNSTGSFHLSGEQAVGPGSFSWQGKLTGAGKLKGKVLLNEFPAQTILEQLYTDTDFKVSGSSEFTGSLSLSTVNKTSTTYSLDNATLQFHDLQLTEKDTTWLKAESVRFTRLNRQKTRFSLGNIFLKNAALELTHKEYPQFLNHVFGEKTRPEIGGIDFSGTLNIRPQQKQKQTILLSDVKFQANRLDKKKNPENFIFTAKLGEEGVVKARGKIDFFPLMLETNMAFSDMDSALFSPYFQEWPLLQYSEAMLHGKGLFTYPTSSFDGNLRLSDGRLQLSKNTSLLNWDLAELTNIRCRFTPFSLTSDYLSLQNPQLQQTIGTSSSLQQISDTLRNILAKDDDKKDLFSVHINKTSFTNGTITLIDTRLKPPWKEAIDSLSGHINNLNSNKNGISSFDIGGNIAGATLTFSGSTFLFQEKKNNRARLSISDFPLGSLAKQLKNIGLETETASVSLQAQYQENDIEASSKTNLTFTNIQPLSTKSDTAFALALLNNSSGIFNLSVQRDDISRSLFQEVIDTFQTTVIKASYAPLLLDREFKDLQDNNFISFQPGTSKISAAGKELAIRYSELLATHPALALSITGLADTKTDRKRQVVAVPAAQKKIVSNKELLILAKERSLITYDFFIHSLGISSARISINDSPLLRKVSPGNGSILDLEVAKTKD